MMTKGLWLEILEKALKKMPKCERNKVLEFYREMIEDKIECGISEDAVVNSLGNPSDIAEKILLENGIKVEEIEVEQHREIKKEDLKKKGIPYWLACLLGIVVVPVYLSLTVAWFAVLITFWVVFGSMVISAGACFIASFVSIFLGISGYVGGGWALFGGCVAGTGVLMLLAVAFWYLAKGMSKATKWIFSKKARRGE